MKTDNTLLARTLDDSERPTYWVLSVALTLGWVLGVTLTLSEPALALWFGFLAGAIVINTLRAEIPHERDRRFWPFVAGIASFSAMAFLIEADEAYH